MLESLYVKNLALIREAELIFGKGFNILSGETGAGKSVLIGSVNLALGGRFEKEMLRAGADHALVELCFSGEDQRAREYLCAQDIPVEDVITITRKLSVGKSVSKINGETVNTRQVKELAELLIDIHGQHEHQSLLKKKKHLEILDSYIGERASTLRKSIQEAYDELRRLEEKLQSDRLDEEARKREEDLLRFEEEEIRMASLKPGEDEAAEERYRLLCNSKKISEAVAEVLKYLSGDESEGAGSLTGRGLRALRSVSEYDEKLRNLERELSEIEDLLGDASRELSSYLEDLEFGEEEFAFLEHRLNELNRLKNKYAADIPGLLQAAEEKRARLEELANYEEYLLRLTRDKKQAERTYEERCGELSLLRTTEGEKLAKKLKDALKGLNFESVDFRIAIRPNAVRTPVGYDDVEFLISTNPGEEVRPLSLVASGGELSRIMLAIKTVLAAQDSIDTLIFDEIDSGISGRTAWKVSQQLGALGSSHQVICITHLPQIAAMADRHFLIEKSSEDNSTQTTLRRLEDEEISKELARLLGAGEISSAALENAKQMHREADEFKKAYIK